MVPRDTDFLATGNCLLLAMPTPLLLYSYDSFTCLAQPLSDLSSVHLTVEHVLLECAQLASL